MSVSRLTIFLAVFATSGFPFATESLPVQKVLTADIAQEMAIAALEKCRGDGFHVAVTVVDQDNLLKSFIRDDGASLSAMEMGRMKANTTMWFGRPSAPDIPAGAPVPAPALPGASNFAGSLPVRAGGELIGAISVSGAPSGDKDAACAAAGLNKVSGRLK